MLLGFKATLLLFIFRATVITALNNLDDSRQFKTVKITQGLVKGYLSEGVFTFYGIPYATAPKGNYKFKAPLPAPSWTNTLEAVDKSVACPQANSPEGQANVTTTEDCLVANVFTPDTDEDKLPVVVLIYGGAFNHAYGNEVTPLSVVKDGNVIFVSFNYRLSLYGFLCLGTESSPGNAGLKDTISLLKWVNKNIASFGGNPDDVTVTGYSAGAALAALVLISEATQGLYSKVILQSTSSLSSRGVVLDPVEYAAEYAKCEGLKSINVKQLEEFYLNLPNEKVRLDNAGTPDGALYFAPCVQQKMSEGAVLTDDPFKKLSSSATKKVPVLISITDMEGLFRLKFFHEYSMKMNANFSEFLPRDLKFHNRSEKEDVAKRVKQFYFGDEMVVLDNQQGYIDFFTDTTYGYLTHRLVRALVNGGNKRVFLYYYTYPGGERGAGHTAQSVALYDQTAFSADESHIPESRKRIKRILRDILYNFVRNGAPVPSPSASYPAGWPAAGGGGSPYMEVSLTPGLRHHLLCHRFAFWDHIYQHRRRHPVPPPKSEVTCGTLKSWDTCGNY